MLPIDQKSAKIASHRPINTNYLPKLQVTDKKKASHRKKMQVIDQEIQVIVKENAHQ